MSEQPELTIAWKMGRLALILGGAGWLLILVAIVARLSVTVIPAFVLFAAGGIVTGIALLKSLLDGEGGLRISLLALLLNGGTLALAYFLLSHAKFG